MTFKFWNKISWNEGLKRIDGPLNLTYTNTNVTRQASLYKNQISLLQQKDSVFLWFNISINQFIKKLPFLSSYTYLLYSNSGSFIHLQGLHSSNLMRNKFHDFFQTTCKQTETGYGIKPGPLFHLLTQRPQRP